MTEEVKEWWEFSSEGFQETSDVSVGFNWGWDLDTEALLGDIAGKEVLELGCGGGQDTVALTNLGATVTGIDLTRAQLEHAVSLAADHDVTVDLVEGDITELPFTENRFDLAYNTYVFQWVDDLEACFAETQRVLTEDGQFVFSMPHPFFTLADPDSHEIVESYFDTGRQVRVDQRERHPDLVTYRRKISDVYNALYDAGFTVEQMIEPGSPDPADHEAGPWGESPPELQAKLPIVFIIKARVRD